MTVYSGGVETPAGGAAVLHPPSSAGAPAEAEAARPGARDAAWLPAPRWLKPMLAATVLGLGLLSIATMLLDHRVSPMPDSHLVMVPITVAAYAAAWGLDLAGMRIPRLAFALAVVGPHIALSLIGHSGLHTLFLLLLVGWVAYTGRREESLAALGLALAAIGVAAAVDAADGLVVVSAWISWAAGTVALWLLSQTVVAQQRLVLELRQTQANLAEQMRENTGLHQQAQHAAILEERQRLARELHDSATQSMYSARMYAEAAQRLLAGGDTATVAEYLREVKDAARDALAEMRLLIYELHPPVLEDQGLVAALRLRLEAVEGRAGLAAELNTEPRDFPPLPRAIEQELYRLAQEGLNNILKHARASRIIVKLRQEPGMVTLEIADDGVGFDPAAQAGGHGGLGLRGMRERVAQLGGTLRVESAPGAGTRVRVEVPR